MPVDKVAKQNIRADNDAHSLSEYVSEHWKHFHIPRGDGVFIPQEHFPAVAGFYFSRNFWSFVVHEASTESSRPTNVRMLDFDDPPRTTYDNFRALLGMDSDLDLYHVRWLLDNHANNEDGAFSIEGRNIIPFDGNVIVIMHSKRKKSVPVRKSILTTDAARGHEFSLRQGDRILLKR